MGGRGVSSTFCLSFQKGYSYSTAAFRNAANLVVKRMPPLLFAGQRTVHGTQLPSDNCLLTFTPWSTGFVLTGAP